MKILIAGFGSIGRRHLRNLQAAQQELTQRGLGGEHDVMLLRSNRSTLPLEEIANIPVETDLQAALAAKPDAVIISNPTALHLDVAIPAAEAGCAILLEKPISHSMERIDELQAAARRGGARILVGFQLRFHPTLRLAAERIAAGEIGAVQSVRAHWGEYLPNWHPWEDYRQGYAARADLGGGVILTLCHPLDYVRFVIGEVSEVWAFTGQSSDLQLPVEDSAEIGLRFANGAVGSVHLDYVQQPPSHTLEVIGSAGMLRWNAADGALSIYSPATQVWQVHLPPEGFDRNWLFMDEMRNFLALARKAAEPVCTLQDGIRALQIALAARESAADGLKKSL